MIDNARKELENAKRLWEIEENKILEQFQQQQEGQQQLMMMRKKTKVSSKHAAAAGLTGKANKKQFQAEYR